MSNKNESRFSGQLEPLRYWTGWLFLFASVLTVAFLIFDVFRSSRSTTLITLVSLMSAMFAALWVWVIVGEFRHKRNLRYASAVPDWHQALHDLRDAAFLRTEGDQHSEALIEKLTESITAFGRAFNTVTGTTVNACVKQLETHTTDPSRDEDTRQHSMYDMFVTEVCRNKGSTKWRSSDPNHRDWINRNTDFTIIFKQQNNHFFSNDLSKEDPYDNSHFSSEMLKTKKYPYYSTIIWPIRKKILDPEVSKRIGASHEDEDLIGFLCIDSKRKNVFKYDFDFWMGAAYADILYPLLKPWFAERLAAKKEAEE